MARAIRVGLCLPGQGSQAPGMAGGLLDLPVSREMLDEAGQAGLDLAAAVGGDGEHLRRTEIAQPALLLVEVALATLLPAELTVVAAAGHSLGEYAALVAAGAVTPRVAMRLVVERGRLMALTREGAMAALLGLDEEAAQAICAEVRTSGTDTVVVANLNAPGQVVVSGGSAGVAAASRLARERGARQVRVLNVGGAFHSPLMADAGEAFSLLLDAAPITRAAFPVVSNVDGRERCDPDELRAALRGQLVRPVQWAASVRRLTELGSEALVELGPGRVLTGLARRTVPGHPALAASSPEEVRALAERIAEVVPGGLPVGGAADG